MAETSTKSGNWLTTSDDPARRFFPILLVLFIASGCAALIYEVVWFQLVQLVIGSSAVSIGVLLGTYMGGMLLGSLLLPRLIDGRYHPLRVYAGLELGIGIIGIAMLFGMPLLDHIYIAHFGYGFAGLLFRGAICAVTLLPPTVLMGATLPAVSRWLEMTPRGVSRMGILYGANTAGAVFGCLIAGFFLLREYDVAAATGAAASINAIAALIAFALASVSTGSTVNNEAASNINSSRSGATSVYIIIALSGFTALGAEVIWTRLLSLVLGGTVYTFSIILAVFLTGLGFGSGIGSIISRTIANPRAALGWCQTALTISIAWAAYTISESLPYLPIDLSLTTDPWFSFQLDLMRSFWVILPAACLWGASFPLALASVATPGRDPGRQVGAVYAANTLGAIIGSLSFSMVFIPWIGTSHAQQLMIVISGMSAMTAFIFTLIYSIRDIGLKKLTAGFSATTVVVIGLTVFSAWSVPPVFWGMAAYGRMLPTWQARISKDVTPAEQVPAGGINPDVYCIYSGEGMNESVAVTLMTNGVRQFHATGKVQASSHPGDMRLQRMLGHISALVHDDPKSVLVVACGAGVTAGSYTRYPEVQRIVICEIEKLVPERIAPFFEKENYGVVHDPRTQVICDDGRHFIRTTHEKFDVITSDPIDPWVKGCAALYTKEYFEMCRSHLNPGGVLALWVPFYQSNEESVRSLIATFFTVFPEGIIWSNEADGQGYDSVLFGQNGPTVIDVDKLQERLDRPDYSPVAQSLSEVGFPSAVSLLSTYAGSAPDLAGWLKDAPINTDRNLRLQYLAGLGSNSYVSDLILKDILAYYRFPGNIFKGTPETIEMLQYATARSPY